jgi:hypothetical protein
VPDRIETTYRGRRIVVERGGSPGVYRSRVEGTGWVSEAAAGPDAASVALGRAMEAVDGMSAAHAPAGLAGFDGPDGHDHEKN